MESTKGQRRKVYGKVISCRQENRSWRHADILFSPSIVCLFGYLLLAYGFRYGLALIAKDLNAPELHDYLLWCVVLLSHIVMPPIDFYRFPQASLGSF